MDGSRTVLIKEVFRLYDEKKATGRPLKLELASMTCHCMNDV